jgi:hypothetical protein
VIGFYEGSDPTGQRHFVVDARGVPIRPVGFARVGAITGERGRWMLARRDEIQWGDVSVWTWKRMKMQ